MVYVIYSSIKKKKKKSVTSALHNDGAKGADALLHQCTGIQALDLLESWLAFDPPLVENLREITSLVSR